MRLRWRYRRIWRRLAVLLAVLGPGVITSNVDNDAGGIYTYSLCGAQYGYSLLWLLIPVGFVLLLVQEMCARMGAVTGKGLADLIREEFGLRVTFFLMMALLATNLANTVAEFAGLATGLEVLGISRYIAVPLGAVFVWWLVVFGTYKTVEKAFLIACLLYLAYPVSALLARPDWNQIAEGSLVPRAHFDLPGLAMLVGMVGTTIAPWMQFYLQSSVVEKEVRVSEYARSRLDVVLGTVMAVVVAAFIVIACAATLHQNGVMGIESAAEAAKALAPFAGKYAETLFAFGLANASLFAASILPLATAYSVCEGMGLEAGVNKRFNEAPEFYGLYTAIIAIGAGLVLMPGIPLLRIILVSQIMNGVLLPFVLIFMVILINRKELMGEFANGRIYNAVVWASTVILIVLSLFLVATSFMPTKVQP